MGEGCVEGPVEFFDLPVTHSVIARRPSILNVSLKNEDIKAET
jgi:hypothetical protein